MAASCTHWLSFKRLPALLPCKPLVEQCKNFGHVELDVFEIQVVLVVFLHFKEVVQLQVKFEESPVATY